MKTAAIPSLTIKRSWVALFEDVGSRNAASSPHERVYGVHRKTLPSPPKGTKNITLRIADENWRMKRSLLDKIELSESDKHYQIKANA